MVYVEGGEFDMGGTEEQDGEWGDNERPVHRVKIDSYYIGKFEITQSQWERVMGTTLRDQLDKVNWDELYGEGETYPMYFVNHTEAMAFCDSLSKRTGKKYTLPTEAQWEYAARGGNKGNHYKYSGSDDIETVAWYEENSDHLSHPVGSKNANELGIFDMSGNVREWCADWYGSYKAEAADNPTGALSGEERVERGGSFGGPGQRCRVSFRRGFKPEYRSPYLGFRIVREL